MRQLIDRLESRQLFAVAPGFIDSVFAADLSSPTAMAFAPDGRLFVAQQNGALRVIKDGALLPDPAIDLDVDSSGERGLLGVAFDPAFAQNALVYLYYTAESPTTHNRVSRFTLAGDTLDAGSEQVLIDLPTLGQTNHNGGAIHFGNDGKLYIAVGDNGDAGTAQPLSTVLGKILRLNADGSIPADNPFFNETTGQSQAIWARGLRNPYTFAFRSDGRMHINDVGQQAFEEINLGVAAANYGWPIIEGKRTTETPPANYVDPLFAYDRSGGAVSGSSIAGGAFYERPAGATENLPAALEGDYLFADFGSGIVKSLDIATGDVSPVASSLANPVDLAVGPDGAVYVLEYVAGRVTRITAAPPDLAITIARQPRSFAAENSREVVKASIENVGEVRVKGRVTVRLLASADGVVDTGDVVLDSVSKPLALRAGGEAGATLRFRYPAGLSGAFTLLAELKSDDDRIVEEDQTDNIATATVQIAPPFIDLTPTFAASSVVFDAPRRQTIDFEVQNLGNVAFVGRIDVAVELTPAGGGTAVPIRQRTIVRIIPAQAPRPATIRFRLPDALAAGSYDLSVRVTGRGDRPDANSQNDTATIAATVPN